MHALLDVHGNIPTWFAEQFAKRKGEPNSGLGQAITYMRDHRDKLTLFLRQSGAPLDNNLCEES
jgi:transposase